VFLQNYLPAAWWAREHGWSLAVEEHFYLLLPPALLLVRWARFRRAPVRWAAAIVGCLAALTLGRRLLMVLRGADAVPVLFATHFRLDALAFGVLLSVVWHYAPGRVQLFRRLRSLLMPAGLLLTVPCYFLDVEHPFVITLGLTLNYLGYGMVLAAALTMPRLLPSPLARPLAWIGFYSYSIYLWHLPWLAVCRASGFEEAGRALVYYAGSITIGVVLAKLVELPALRLRERWLPAEPDRVTA